MVCHLSDSCRVVTGQKTVSDASGLIQRTILKWTALYVPMPWPAGILTRPEIDQRLGGTSPVDFAADVAELVMLVEVFTSQVSSVERPPHPIFGKLSDKQWLRWGYLHMDHHLRQFGV